MHVPEGWKYEKLGCVAFLQRGFDLPKSNRINGNVPIISSSGVSGYHNSAQCQAPGVITGRYGSIGDVFFVEEDYWPLNTSLWVKSFCGNNPKYVYYLLSKIDYKKFSDKTGVPGVNRNDLHAIKVPVPPLLEQQKIAQILSTWDKAIEKLEALITAKQKRKKSLMQQLLTGKKRFSGFEGEWDEIRLKKVIKEEKSRNKNSSVIRVLSVTNHSGFVLPEEQFSRRVASNDISNYKIVCKGQFGYNPSRINVGSFARLDKYNEGVLSPMYVIFSINEKTLDSNFFLNWMSSHETKQRISSSTQGSVRDSVGFGTLSSFLINLPSIDEQQKIASVLSCAGQEIETHQKQLATFKKQKKGLMQQLLTGKKRVKLEEAA